MRILFNGTKIPLAMMYSTDFMAILFDESGTKKYTVIKSFIPEAKRGSVLNEEEFKLALVKTTVPMILPAWAIDNLIDVLKDVREGLVHSGPNEDDTHGD